MVVGVKKSKQNFASAEILVLVFKSSDSYTVYHYFTVLDYSSGFKKRLFITVLDSETY